jgi:hypothetical protein
MAVNRIIQVAGSNSLPKVKDIEGMKKELRDHVVKLNEALRQLSQLVYTSSTSGGTGTTTVVVTPADPGAPVAAAEEEFKKHFMFLGE